MEKIELMEELQVHYKDFVKRMKGRVSYDDYETQSLLEGYSEELASFISQEIDKAREEVFTEDERYHLVNLLEGGLRITDSISQSEIFKGILSKLKDNK